MENFLAALRGVHVLAGALGLLLFWLPILSRKGSPLHKRCGRWFLWCVNVIGVSALVSVGLRLGGAWYAGNAPTQQPVFGFLVFLAYLAVAVLVGGWYMRHVVLHKQDVAGLRRPLAWLMAVISLFSSVALILIALTLPSNASLLMFALSPIGLLNAWGMQRHLRFPHREPRAWFYEHMGQALGLGIAFHAAFFVFGARSVFGQWLTGFWGMLPWLAPVVIGVAANMIWERYYRRKAAQARAQ